MRHVLLLLSIMPTLRASDGSNWIEKVIPTAIVGLFTGIGVHQHHTASSKRSQREIDSLHEAAEETSKFIDRLEEQGMVAKKNGALYIHNPLNTALNKAILENDITAINVLFRYAPTTFNINASDDKGHRAIHLAAYKGNPESIEFLLARNAEVNAHDLDGKTALHYAIIGGHPISVQALLEHDANPLATDTKGMHALHYAASLSRPRMIRILAEHLADPTSVNQADKAGRTPLSIAMERPHRMTIRLLLELGANPNTQDRDGMTALHHAVQAGNLEVLKLLIAAGGNINQQNKDNKRPIELARGTNKQRIIDYILSLPNAQDLKGMTHLHHAAKDGDIDAMRKLIEQGAHINAKDDTGRTPLMHALATEQKDVIDYLLSLKKIHHAGTTKEETEYLAHHIGALHMCMEIKDPEQREKATDLLLNSLTERDLVASSHTASSSSASSSSSSANPPTECSICCHQYRTDRMPCTYSCCGAKICSECIKVIKQEVCPYCRDTDFSLLSITKMAASKPPPVED